MAGKIVSRYRVPFAFTPIPTHFIDDGWFFDLPSSQLKVAVAVMRLTWGFRKPKDHLAIDQIAERAHISRSTTKRALKELSDAGIVRISGVAKRNRVYEIVLFRRLNIDDPSNEFGRLMLDDPTVGSPMMTHTIDNRKQNIVSLPRPKAGTA